MDERFLIVRGEKASEQKYRKELSALLLKSFGQPPYDAEKVNDILLFCQDFFITHFETICDKERSYSFYREVIWLHEQAVEVRRSKKLFENLPAGIDKSYLGIYRRVLKLIIEQGCCIDMYSGEKRDAGLKEKLDTKLSDLLFLGEMILICAESLAEQLMVEDAIEISFNENSLYQLSRKHHYEVVMQHLGWKYEQESPEYIIDETGSQDFEKAIKTAFGVDYEKIREIIEAIMAHFNRHYGDCVSFDQQGFVQDIANNTGTPFSCIEKFFSGLTLHRKNKLPLTELAKKPHSIDRFLYRPLLSYKLDGKDFYVFGLASWFESYNSLVLNAIPWGKMPLEWEDIPVMRQYKKQKEQEHDKWLDDQIEVKIKNTNSIYQRGVKKLVTKNKSYPLDPKTAPGLGEIDFLIISPDIKKIFIAECKHLVGRYDMINQRNDYFSFTQDDGKKLSFESRLNAKVQWLTSHLHILEEHFRFRDTKFTLPLADYIVEGIFFINTPTFYMYNSSLRIYTHDKVEEVIQGKYEDYQFSYWVHEEEADILYSVKYPYFKKPKLVRFDMGDEDEEVDKYGRPIKKR